MKPKLKTLVSLILLFSGLVSCSEEKSKPAAPFDIVLRTYSPKYGDSQRLSSFGNAQVSINDYLILYSGEDLFPQWDLQQVKSYSNTILDKTVIESRCFSGTITDTKPTGDTNSSRQLKTFYQSQIRLFEILPAAFYLSQDQNISCEVLISAHSKRGEVLHIPKTLQIQMDASTDFRLVENTTADRHYITKNDFIALVDEQKFFDIEAINLICDGVVDAKDELHIMPLYGKDEDLQSSTQRNSISERVKPLLENARICRFLGERNGDKFLSEVFVLKNQLLRVDHVYYANLAVRTNDRRHNLTHYKFQLTNTSSVPIFIKTDSSAYRFIFEDYVLNSAVAKKPGKGRYVYYQQVKVSLSKAPLSNGFVLLQPNETLDVTFDNKTPQGSMGIESEYRTLEHGYGRIVRVTLEQSKAAIRIKEDNDSPYSLELQLQINPDLLRSTDDTLAKSPYKDLRVIDYR